MTCAPDRPGSWSHRTDACRAALLLGAGHAHRTALAMARAAQCDVPHGQIAAAPGADPTYGCTPRICEARTVPAEEQEPLRRQGPRACRLNRLKIGLRAAQPGEAAALSELALRSKAHWGYDADFLEACRGELTIADAELSIRRVTVAHRGDWLAGFFTLEGGCPVGELGMLFVEPVVIGRGVGSRLLRCALAAGAELGMTHLRLDAEPAAVPFYLAHGAVAKGSTRSGSIAGRRLPVLLLPTGQS